ncbi:hypothetical protein QQS21_004898 [Conoideocrella luteorostrata]|uniref:Uncharacterized protein n=1 Tax=Conoideocrella luteorostrata TaxID=1105319 RepID=A0AAJ0CT05_9HYPO|nr:hypothetical protein QQS21_004898 [Conoideocrella luteorostrata]
MNKFRTQMSIHPRRTKGFGSAGHAASVQRCQLYEASNAERILQKGRNVASLSLPTKEQNRRSRIATIRRDSSPRRVQTRATFRQAPTLERFARQGGPEFSGTRSPVEPQPPKERFQSSVTRASQPPSKSNATPNTTSTRSTGPYDRAFEQNLTDHNIFSADYEFPDGALPPELGSMGDILQARAQPRPSLSPSRFSNDDFRRFKRADARAFNEHDVTTNMIPFIEGTVPDSKCVAGDIPFTHLDDIADGIIVAGKPDLYYGARPEQLNINANSPDGTLTVASRQLCYNGALGARYMHSLQSYGQPEPEYDNNAYTISSMYHGGTLKMYTSHPIPPRAPGGRPDFVTTQIKTWGSQAIRIHSGKALLHFATLENGRNNKEMYSYGEQTKWQQKGGSHRSQQVD